MSLTDRYRALPRSGKWLLWAGLGILLYFPLVEAPLNIWQGLSSRADSLQAQLGRFHDRTSDGLDAELELGATHHGRIEAPDERAVVSNRLELAISRIFENRSVGNYNLTSRSTAMGRNSQLSDEGRPLERLIKEINFEADPSTVLAILADLERDPIISHAPSVLLQRLEDQGTVRAQFQVEAWAISEGGGA